jgi:hypothetical protein
MPPRALSRIDSVCGHVIFFAGSNTRARTGIGKRHISDASLASSFYTENAVGKSRPVRGTINSRIASPKRPAAPDRVVLKQIRQEISKAVLEPFVLKVFCTSFRLEDRHCATKAIKVYPAASAANQ